MTKERIIELWRQGYNVEQIVNMNEIVQTTKKDENVVKYVKNKVEKTILEYQNPK